jgi:hypothetical protein|tara:strand:+ start:386 stop:622 length:237 start_codon:yes stop_codon:yes gene_type:complete
MDELMDMIAADDSASQVSDKIKDILYGKSSQRVDEYRPAVASGVFNSDNAPTQSEVDAALDTETEVETEVDTEEQEEE